MNRHKLIKTLVLLAALFLFFITAPLLAAETVIKGKVVEVDSPRVKIAYEGQYAPNAGDTVKIGFKLGNDFIPVEGDWKIVNVSAQFAWAQAKGAGAGTPAPDYLAVIQSNHPTARSALVSKEEKDEKKIKEPPKDPATIYQEALKYYNGDGVPKDYKKASELLKEAGEMGHVLAQYYMGWMYQLGKGIEKDPVKAISWYKKAADQNHANAKNNLGVMYLNGEGVKKDYGMANKLFRGAADGGHQWGYFNLGRLYDNGWGVPKNEQKALEYYKKFGDYVSAYKDGARSGNEEAKQWLRKRNMNW